MIEAITGYMCFLIIRGQSARHSGAHINKAQHKVSVDRYLKFVQAYLRQLKRFKIFFDSYSNFSSWFNVMYISNLHILI